MAWCSSTLRVMISLFDHDLAPCVFTKKKHGRSFRQRTRWDREHCRAGFLQCREMASQPRCWSLQIERAISWGQIKTTKTEEARTVRLTARLAEALGASANRPALVERSRSAVDCE